MTVVSAKSFPDGASLPLVADIQYREPYSSAAFNRKLRGILGMGLYKGLYPMPGSGLNLLISSQDSGDTSGTASFDIGDDYQITVRQQADITIAMTAGTSKIVALQCIFGLGIETYQVNSDSTIQAAEIVLLDAGTTLGSNQLELGVVTIPADATQITTDMIDVSGRILQTIGIELSSSIDGTSETVAANSYAIKCALDSVAEKYALLGSNADITSMSALSKITGDALEITGSLTLSSSLNVSGITTLTNAVTLSSTLAVSQAVALTDDLTTGGSLTVMGDSTLIGDVTIAGTLTNDALYGRLVRVRVIKTSQDYPKPSEGITKILVSATGAGGGGGGTASTGSSQVAAAAGGGGGSTAKSLYDIEDLEFPIAMTIGKGGTSGVWGSSTGAGGAGSATKFGSYLYAGAGAGAANCDAVTTGYFRLVSNGGGGAASGGNILNARGAGGGRAIILNEGYESGEGGASLYSAGGDPIASGSSIAGIDGTYGAGGGGAFATINTSALNGGKGGDGVIFIWEFA